MPNRDDLADRLVYHLTEATARQTLLVHALETTRGIGPMIEGLLRAGAEEIARIEAARDRLATGAYGVCITCSRPIAEQFLAERLDAMECAACLSDEGARSSAGDDQFFVRRDDQNADG